MVYSNLKYESIKPNKINPTILVVDDEKHIRSIIRQYLGERYDVHEAADSNEGLRKFYNYNPDIVIHDVNLPGMDGYTSAKIMKDENPDIGIIMITAYCGIENAAKSIHSKVDCFLPKPFELRELDDSIKVVYNKIIFNELQRENENMNGLAILVKTIECQDPYTAGHSERVRELSIKIANQLGLPKHEIYKIAKAAYVHDIGKIDYDIMQVVKKEGKLTEIEFKLIKKHPVMSVDILKVDPRFKDCLDIVACHHKNNDGSGYPENISKDDIPFGAKIVKVADVYDALTTSRPYRGAMSIEKAISIMKENIDKEFHPDPLHVLLEMENSNIR